MRSFKSCLFHKKRECKEWGSRKIRNALNRDMFWGLYEPLFLLVCYLMMLHLIFLDSNKLTVCLPQLLPVSLYVFSLCSAI